MSNLTHEQLFGMSLEEEQALSGTRATSSAAQLQRSASSSSIPGALAEWQRQDGVEGQPSGRALQRTLAVQRQVEAPVISAWAIVGSLGWNVLNGTLTQAGDIGYSFDEMEGTKFPNDDKDAFRTRHKYNITSGRQEIDVWEGTASFKKIGIKFAINYEHDGYSVSSISMSLLDTYDWPLWSGTVAVNITPLRGLAGDASKVRISINVQWSRTFTGGGDSAEYELTGANALNFVRRSSNELFVRP